MNIAQVLPSLKLMPLVAAESSAQAIEDATSFRDAGFPLVEILCRTPNAVEIIGEACRALPDLFIGAGTILTVELGEQAIAAGAKFLVSPACDPAIIELSKRRGVQFMPGVYTPSDVAIAMRNGFTWLKLFPAEPAGGVEYISALASPFGHTKLQLVAGCGVTKENYATYLKHPLVGAIIPDWLSPLRGKALRDELPATRKLLQSV
jgi:2-dehydro-3-deoxyphosphogluconate aldolase / (4S)-4-hydroxy-2-oxoglutarate aldolase